jgi:hypothetical protein
MCRLAERNIMRARTAALGVAYGLSMFAALPATAEDVTIVYKVMIPEGGHID